MDESFSENIIHPPNVKNMNEAKSFARHLRLTCFIPDTTLAQLSMETIENL